MHRTTSMTALGILCLALAFPARAATTYMIQAAAGTNGAVLPTGAVVVPAGSTQAFAIRPETGYLVKDVVVDGASVGPLPAYAFTNARADHTISAVFTPAVVNTVPYQETFANRPTGFLPINTNGWYGEDAERAVAIRAMTMSYSNALPVSRVERPSTNVMELNSTSVSRYFTWPEDIVWIDIMMNAAHMMRPSVDVDPGARFAFYVNTNAHFMLWHDALPENVKRWTEFTDTYVDTDEWIRVAIKIDYKTFELGHYFLQVYLNGVALTNASGLTSNRRGGVSGGSWFALATTNRPKPAPLTISGNGLFGEMLVNTNHPGFPSRVYTITAAAHGAGGRLSHPGVARVAEGWNKIYRFTADPGYAVAEVTVDGKPAGRLPGYAFVDTRERHTLDVQFAPVLKTVCDGPGTVTPAGDVLLLGNGTTNVTFRADPGAFISGIWTQTGTNAEAALPGAFGPDLVATTVAWRVDTTAEPGRLRAACDYRHYVLTVNSQWGGATVNGEDAPSGYGHTYNGNTSLVCAVHSPLVIGANHFTCTGWSGTGSVPTNGAGTATPSFHLLQDSAITWQWTVNKP